ncbi:jerky protein homolog-like [Lethenteron reissneri]|uniref:jerky protein homolog-like n=1 Tax=Lethenteron reissneri TaxID=7753 RepID=UPI002AB64F66|nr:jerky protein homolog-like [Lethenteron reissneri]
MAGGIAGETAGETAGDMTSETPSQSWGEVEVTLEDSSGDEMNSGKRKQAYLTPGASPLLRKRIVLSLETKLRILRRLEKGETAKQLALEFNLGHRTIYDIKKAKEKLWRLNKVLDVDTGLSYMKVIRESRFPQLEEAVYKWFRQHRAMGLPITSSMLIEQARHFHEHLGLTEPFAASAGWLRNFKRRYCIGELGVSGMDLGRESFVSTLAHAKEDLANPLARVRMGGAFPAPYPQVVVEKVSDDAAEALAARESFMKFLEEQGLSPQQVYAATETGLYWKSLPARTAAGNCRVGRDRIALLLCASAAGAHRLPLAVVGRAAHPRVFRNLDVSLLPVHYYNHRRAWVTTDIFRRWFRERFVPEVTQNLEALGLPPKAVLLLDNSPAHPDDGSLCCGDITVFYLPPNLAPALKPLEQGAVGHLKALYRREVARGIALGVDADLQSYWKDFTVKHALYTVATAWDAVHERTLQRCWRKLWPRAWGVAEPGIPDLAARGEAAGGAHGEGTRGVQEDEEGLSVRSFVQVLRAVPGCDRVGESDVAEWLEVDAADPGRAPLGSGAGGRGADGGGDASDGDNSEQEEETVPVSRITHKEAVRVLSRAIEYAQEQADTDHSEVYLLMALRDQALKKHKQHARQRVLGYAVPPPAAPSTLRQ